MSNTKAVQKIIKDVQCVLNEASDKLDHLVNYRADEEQPETKKGLTVEEACRELLKKYQGHEPSLGDVLTFKTAIELTLHNDYEVSTSKFE